MLPRAGERRADASGQVVTHGRRSGVGDKALTLFQTHSLERDDAGRGVAADNDVIVAKFGGELLDKVVRIQRWPWVTLFRLHHWVTLDAFAAPGQPRGV